MKSDANTADGVPAGAILEEGASIRVLKVAQQVRDRNVAASAAASLPASTSSPGGSEPHRQLVGGRAHAARSADRGCAQSRRAARGHHERPCRPRRPGEAGRATRANRCGWIRVARPRPAPTPGAATIRPSFTTTARSSSARPSFSRRSRPSGRKRRSPSAARAAAQLAHIRIEPFIASPRPV